MICWNNWKRPFAQTGEGPFGFFGAEERDLISSVLYSGAQSGYNDKKRHGEEDGHERLGKGAEDRGAGGLYGGAGRGGGLGMDRVCGGIVLFCVM